MDKRQTPLSPALYQTPERSRQGPSSHLHCGIKSEYTSGLGVLTKLSTGPLKSRAREGHPLPQVPGSEPLSFSAVFSQLLGGLCPGRWLDTLPRNFTHPLGIQCQQVPISQFPSVYHGSADTSHLCQALGLVLGLSGFCLSDVWMSPAEHAPNSALTSPHLSKWYPMIQL